MNFFKISFLRFFFIIGIEELRTNYKICYCEILLNYNVSREKNRVFSNGKILFYLDHLYNSKFHTFSLFEFFPNHETN